MTSITILNKDLGFFTESTVTIQRFDEEGDLIWCNHAGAEEEEAYNQVDRVDQSDLTWTEIIKVCDKCGAWQFDGDREWHEAPMDGVHYD